MSQFIDIRYNYGGWWDADGTKYVGGDAFQPEVGFDVDMFSFWCLKNFYTHTLKMRSARLWYKQGDVNGDGGFVEILDDRSVLEMVREQQNCPVTDVFGVEEGDVLTSLRRLKSRLEAALRRDKGLENEQMSSEFLNEEWSDDHEDIIIVDNGNRGNVDKDSEDSEDDEDFVPDDEDEDVEEDEDIDDDLDEVEAEEDEVEAIPEVEDDVYADIEDEVEVEAISKVKAIVGDEDEMADPIILGDTELLDVIHDSDEEVVIEYPWFNGEVDKAGKLILVNGMKFKDVDSYRAALKEWSINKGCLYIYTKNTKEKVTALCPNKCGFRIYASAIKNSIAERPALIPLPPVPKFLYMYIRFTAQKHAFFSGLRPFVGLDGCFLKGVMGGQLLSAVAKDGNDSLYPLAVAVVDAEDKASWTWFLQNLLDDFGHPRDTGMVFMSDKQKGLQEAINQLMPGVEHRICVKHLYENFKGTYKGREFKELLWLAASTGSLPKWQYYLDKMKKLPMGDEAVSFLMKNDPRSWTRSHFSPHCKTDLIVNNLSESFNASILAGRDKPILSMLEWIRRNLMKKIHDKQSSMASYSGNICPNIMKILDHNKLLASNCFATRAGNSKYEIDDGGSSNVVDLNAKSCTCRMWDLSGLPCKHAIAAIYDGRMEPEAFVDGCYSKATYMEVYKHFIVPLPSSDEWPRTEETDVYPPFIRKPTGRPKKKRRRQVDEAKYKNKITRIGGQVKCGNCKRVGHNVRGCTAAVTGETPWQRRQRLKESQQSEASASTSKTSKQQQKKKQKKKSGLGSQQTVESQVASRNQ